MSAAHGAAGRPNLYPGQRECGYADCQLPAEGPATVYTDVGIHSTWLCLKHRRDLGAKQRTERLSLPRVQPENLPSPVRLFSKSRQLPTPHKCWTDAEWKLIRHGFRAMTMDMRQMIEVGLLGPGTCEWSPPTVFRFDALARGDVDVFAWNAGEECHERRTIDPWDRAPEGVDLDSVLDDLANDFGAGVRPRPLPDALGLALTALAGWIRAEPVHPGDLARWAGHQLGEAVETHGAWVTGPAPWEPREDHDASDGRALLLLDGPGAFSPLAFPRART